MKVSLAYGSGHLDVSFPDGRTVVIEPCHPEPLGDERSAFFDALDHPIHSAPLKARLRKTDRIAISFTDITRATPNERIIPWLFEYLEGHPKDRIVLINQLGSHRPNTTAELEKMLTPEVVARYRVENHDCHDETRLVRVGTMHDGTPALLNRSLVEADFRIVTGFIEPHFFAGFSGGPKGIIPGCAGLATIQASHDYSNIAHPNSSFGIIDGNPLWEELRDIALKLNSTFLVNVSLNHQRQLTGIYTGDLVEAHRAGCAAVKATAMRPVRELFDVVVTTNSGYPLDQNLYQGVKGMSAAARIVKPGGTIILACECSEGVPLGSPYESLLREAQSPEEILARLATPGFRRPEQWQVQSRRSSRKRPM